MGINTPKGTSMDYKNFTPTYSHRHIPKDKMDMDGDEYWTPKALQTHLKIQKLYNVMFENRSSADLLNQVWVLKSKVGIWVIERTDNPLSGDYRRRNLITDSEWEPIYEHKGFFPGIPYGIWVGGEGVMIVLPSKETIEWLNMLSYLYCVSNKQTV
jgi:hypothetical protein